MKQRKLPQSKDAFQNDAIAKFGLILVVCVLPTLFFWNFNEFGLRLPRILLGILWVSMLGMWLLWLWLTKRKWDKSYYALSDDSLIIHKAGLFGVKQKMYRFDSILSVSVHSGPLGSRNNYGSIHIEIPRAVETVILQYVVDPEEQAEAIKSAIAGQPKTQSLVN